MCWATECRIKNKFILNSTLNEFIKVYDQNQIYLKVLVFLISCYFSSTVEPQLLEQQIQYMDKLFRNIGILFYFLKFYR